MSMRYLLFSILLVGCVKSAYSQDIIETTSGEKIESKVVEISEDEIKYRKFSQPDGPLRIISVKNVMHIIYEDGAKEVFVKNDRDAEIKEVKKEIEDIAKEKEELEQELKKLSDQEKMAQQKKDSIFRVENKRAASAKPPKDWLFKNGLYIDILPGWAYTSLWGGLSLGGLGAGFGAKFYFGSGGKYRPGLKVTAVRFQLFADRGPGQGGHTRFYFAPLGIGFANIIKLKEQKGIELNLGGSPTIMEIGSPPEIGWFVSADARYRLGKFAIGIDYALTQTNRKPLHLLHCANISVGFKF